MCSEGQLRIDAAVVGPGGEHSGRRLGWKDEQVSVLKPGFQRVEVGVQPVADGLDFLVSGHDTAVIGVGGQLDLGGSVVARLGRLSCGRKCPRSICPHVGHIYATPLTLQL